MNKPELLAPAGNLYKLKIALKYGADAVYIGGEAFSLRTADGFCKNYLAHCKFNRQKAVIRKLMRITALIICASVR